MSGRKLNLVVAACNNNGIGINGNLPWRLKKEMEFFKKITQSTDNPDKQNAVIMGRKTWMSIPEKFRPLKGRVNIVLSRELKEAPDGVYIARSLQEALSLIDSEELNKRIENVHIIGGSSVYQEAMTGSYPCRIYLTRVLKDFQCDTFLPSITDGTFTKIQNPENVPVELQAEGDIQYRYEVYEKNGGQNESHSVQIQNKPTQSLDLACSPGNEPIKFAIMAAMCHNNRGIGYGMKLPWPSLKRDYEYFTTHVSTLRRPNTGTRKIIHVRGRLTWVLCDTYEKNQDNVYHVIVSSNPSHSEFNHPRVLKVVPSFEVAIDVIDDLHNSDSLDSVWFMGGQKIYMAAIEHSRCNQLYLTHIYTDFKADVFFPQFEDKFQETQNHHEAGIIYEENGIKYEFKVYRRIEQ